MHIDEQPSARRYRSRTVLQWRQGRNDWSSVDRLDGAMGRRYRVLTWHVHGNYLYYLTQAPHDFYVLSTPGREPGYSGRNGHLPWGDNVHDCPVANVRDMEFDCVLFQSRDHWLSDQYRVLTPEQRALPRIYLEHDPPQEHPTDTRHPVDDDEVLVVHVTAFNQLMWDNGNVATRVIEHGVLVPPNLRYSGTLARGVVVVNHLLQRGRRLGLDVFDAVRHHVPLDLVGMAATDVGGLGEIRYPMLMEAEAEYRFFFNPIRYTSLGLAVCEAMTIGMPVVGLATTEMVTVIRNGHNGYIDTRMDRLIDVMHALIEDPALAQEWGRNARRDALARFGIPRFVQDWNRALDDVMRAAGGELVLAPRTGGYVKPPAASAQMHGTSVAGS
jgi:glycosyltransferase involved in cell wall biosynthesis